jgi:hypothetical protein
MAYADAELLMNDGLNVVKHRIGLAELTATINGDQLNSDSINIKNELRNVFMRNISTVDRKVNFDMKHSCGNSMILSIINPASSDGLCGIRVKHQSKVGSSSKVAIKCSPHKIDKELNISLWREQGANIIYSFIF